jgi:hypothetical protein
MKYPQTRGAKIVSEWSFPQRWIFKTVFVIHIENRFRRYTELVTGERNHPYL